MIKIYVTGILQAMITNCILFKRQDLSPAQTQEENLMQLITIHEPNLKVEVHHAAFTFTFFFFF